MSGLRSAQGIILTPIARSNGDPRQVLLTPRIFFYVIAGVTVALSLRSICEMNWGRRYRPASGRRLCIPRPRYGINGGDFVLGIPGPFGAHSWHPMSFSPITRLV